MVCPCPWLRIVRESKLHAGGGVELSPSSQVFQVEPGVLRRAGQGRAPLPFVVVRIKQ